MIFDVKRIYRQAVKHARHTTKKPSFWLRLSQPRGTSWNQRFSLRRSKPASPRTPEPNSAKLLGSGVEAGTNSPDERGPSVECAWPEKTWSILGLFPR